MKYLSALNLQNPFLFMALIFPVMKILGFIGLSWVSTLILAILLFVVVLGVEYVVSTRRNNKG